MSRVSIVLCCALTLGMAAPGSAQQQPAKLPLRTVAPAAAKAPETVGAIRGLRHLPDGRVLVNDASRRRLLLFDATLATYTVVIDSTPGAANSYGRSSAPFFGYVGDSSIFVDYASQSLLIIDEKGKIARVTSPPKPADLMYVQTGTPGMDAQGRMVYRTSIRQPIPTTAPTGLMMSSTPPDSAALVRADWDTGKVDTMAKIKVSSGSRMNMKTAPDGSRSYEMRMSLLTSTDDWTITTDGAIAIVRGQDYHIDWISGDGKATASPKMPYDWRRLSDTDKQGIVDSTRRMMDSLLAAQGGGLRSMSSVNGVTTTTVIPMKYEYAPISEMPDYYPPIRMGSVLADRDGNVWILPYTSAQGQNKGLVYDVVDRKGDVMYRVQLPENRSIAGFGKGGIIYMMAPAPVANPTDRPGSAGFYLERTMLAAPGAESKQ